MGETVSIPSLIRNLAVLGYSKFNSAAVAITGGTITGVTFANPVVTGTLTVPTTLNATDAASKLYVDTVAGANTASTSPAPLLTAAYLFGAL